MEIRQPLPPRHQGNVENYIIILLGIDDKSNIIDSIVNFIKKLNNIEELNSFISTINFEKIILIVNDLLFESIEDVSLFNSIYILSNNLILLNNKHSNIRGNFSNLKLICEEIKEEFLIENNLFSIELVYSNEIENQSFCYSQLLKEIILTEDNEGNLKKDFIDFCRFHYFNNQFQLNLIEQFENNFTLDKSILWFKKNCFIRKMLNRCLRTKEIDILFKMRWIIQIINNQIKENNLSNTVYRIHYLSLDEFEKLKEYSGGLISFGTFLNCSLNKPSIIENLNQMKRILFQIKITNGIEFENEIFLPFDNVYHIESIQNEIINLNIINKDNKQFKQLTNQMREDIQGPNILIQLGKLLISNNNYLYADYLARLLFNDNSLKDNLTLLASLAALHHLLGSFDNKQNNYRAARIQFEQSLKIFLTFVSEDNQILSATYNNIGSMFYQEDQHDQAIIYHQKAIQCQLNSSSPDIQAIATYSGNIGSVYLDQKKYHEALIHYKRSLTILQQATPDEESLAIAMIYDRIASVYWRMDKPDDALPFYQKALQLELKYLKEDDHKISVSYFNLSTAYAKLNRLDDAIDSAEKSLQQLLKTVRPDHPEVKENTEQLEGLRRKKWLQQLYQ
jgi:tetratricopeptide (TPR) repeat protein